MKLFVLDKLVVILIEIGMIAFISVNLASHKTAILFFGFLIFTSFLPIIKRVAVLPIDLILGKVSREGYFSRRIAVVDYEIFHGKNYIIWRFFENNGKTFDLAVPISISKDELYEIKEPPKEKALCIEYYRLSKLLCGWSLAKSQKESM